MGLELPVTIAPVLAANGLMIMGHLPHPDDAKRYILLIGADRGFWEVFTTSPEYDDGIPNPIDRWSKRTLDPLAQAAKGKCLYPSDGPPYAPFIAWARASGRFWQSPTGMLVNDRAGMMISIRGALVLEGQLARHTAGASPCETCETRPCITACPVDALSDRHFYDVSACKVHIASPRGSACMTEGCATRLVCPVSKSFNRSTTQTAFHMRAFKGNQ